MDVDVLPRVGPAREALRERGQFWTPAWLADAMVAWALGGGSDHLYDPAVGGGAFFRAARRVGGPGVALAGCELDAAALAAAMGDGLDTADLSSVAVGDFMLLPVPGRLRAVVANPPYKRHHRFSAEYKATLRGIARRAVGRDLDGRAGLHAFFLVRALTLLDEGGRLAFVVPADVCEGRYAAALWEWIGREFRVDAAVTFAHDATPFPGVDTNPVVLLIRRAPPAPTLRWARVLRPGTPDLLAWCAGDLRGGPTAALDVRERGTAEALSTGLTRAATDAHADAVPLGDLFRVVRGVATGDNDFFLMTSRQAAERGLPASAFVRAIARTRDHAAGARLTARDLDALDARGRPTYLLSLARDDGGARATPALRRYLASGEARGLPARPLIAQRRPWYKMERREPPPWMFAYLGRRACRFVRNDAGAVPLTGFLCVYARDPSRADPEAATAALNDARTLANLPLVGKSYGGGAVKVEPRALERLPVPRAVLAEHGLVAPEPADRLL